MNTTTAGESLGQLEGRPIASNGIKRTAFFRRRKKIIKPRQQLKLACFVVIFLLVYSLVFGLAIFYPLAMALREPATVGQHARAAVVILGLHETIWPALGFVLCLSFVGTILFSHRIAGPIYRLERAVEDFVRGDFKPIRLRKSDEFKEIEDSVNSLARYLGMVQELDAAFHDHVKRTLSQLAETLKGGTQQDSAQALAVVQALVAELDCKTNAFTLRQEA
jgi:hypothetical protein